GHDDAVAELAVVSDVRLREQEVIIAERGGVLDARGTVDLGVLADDVAIADAQPGRGVGVADVLRRVADHRAHVNHVVAPGDGVAGEYGVGERPRAGADRYRTVDDHVGPDIGARVDLCTRIDQRGRVDGHRRSPRLLRRSSGGLVVVARRLARHAVT